MDGVRPLLDEEEEEPVQLALVGRPNVGEQRTSLSRSGTCSTVHGARLCSILCLSGQIACACLSVPAKPSTVVTT